MQKTTSESVADFKARIAQIMRKKEGKSYSVIGAAHAHPCVVRKTTKGKNNK